MFYPALVVILLYHCDLNELLTREANQIPVMWLSFMYLFGCQYLMDQLILAIAFCCTVIFILAKSSAADLKGLVALPI